MTMIMVYACLVDSNPVNSSYGHIPVAKIEARTLDCLILFEATDRELLNIRTIIMTCAKCTICIFVMEMLPRCSEKETKRGPMLCR